MPPTYDYICPKCPATGAALCKMSERDLPENIPVCKDHGPMERQITNNQKHTDNTPWRKGYYNSKDWR